MVDMAAVNKREPRSDAGSESDEDLDDLDDVLENLDRPRATPAVQPSAAIPSTHTAAASTTTSAKPATSSRTAAPQPPPDPLDDDEEAAFEAELAREMEALLSGAGGAGGASGPGGAGVDALRSLGLGLDGGDEDGRGGDAPLDTEQRKAAEELQRLFAAMMDGGAEGASGDGQRIPPAGPGAALRSATGAGAGAGPDKALSFDETIAATLNNLKSSASRAREASSASTSAPGGSGGAGGDPFSALLAQLSGLDPSTIDPALLDALNAGRAGGGGAGGEGDIGSMLDGMMSQLMSREVLEEPLTELAEKYQPYIDAHADLSATTLTTYRTQLAHIRAILAIFGDPAYTDEPPAGPAGQRQREMKDEVGRLMSVMQELGSPPEEVMGEMPEGFDLGDLGGGEQCSIM